MDEHAPLIHLSPLPPLSPNLSFIHPGKKKLALLRVSGTSTDARISTVISTDIQEGTVAFMPPKMTAAAWGMLFAQNDNTGLDKIQDAKPAPIVRRQGPPPKWRTTVVVWISLMATVMPWNYWVAPWLIKDLKVPIFWYLFIILIPVVVALKWFLLPR